MAETLPERNPEQFWRWVRNVNIIGGVAFAGAGVVLPQFQTVLFAGAGISGLQAGAAGVIRQRRAGS